MDEATKAKIAANRAAYVAELKAKRAEQERQQAAALHEMAKQVTAADNPEDALALVARIAKEVPPAAIQAVVATIPPEPVQPEMCPGLPVVPGDVYLYVESNSSDSPVLDVEAAI